MKRNSLIILFTIYTTLLYAQKMMLWRDIESHRFGKDVIFQTKNGEKLNGHYKIAKHNGAFSDISFKNGKLDGKKTDFDWEERLISETFYKDGFPFGKYKSYHQNGKIETQGEYKNGKQHGKWITFDNKGDKKTIETYNEGKENGEFWKKISSNNYEDKIIYTGEYKNGKPVGKWQKNKKMEN